MIVLSLHNFLFINFAVLFVKSDVILRKFEPEDVNKACENGSGTYKLETDCATKNLAHKGFLSGYGVVVCCTSVKVNAYSISKRRKGDAARKYCKNEGWQRQLLDFHILNGEKAEVGEFPHMAALFSLDLNNQSILLCGGSLISEKFILTAAHCFKDGRNTNFFVRMGRVS